MTRMMPMQVKELADATVGRLVMAKETDGQTVLRHSAGVVTDSRQVGPDDVFVAIRGEHVDGHDYVAAVARQGALAAVVDHEMPLPDDVPVGFAQIVVPDTVEALGALARRNLELRRACPEPFTIVALTGSVGKTTTKDLLASLLSQLGPTVAPVGSFNNEIGLPLTALKVGRDTRFLVAEMGANHVGEIARLTAIAPPDVALVLKVGVAHLGEFGSVERIAQAKSELVHGLRDGGMAILNADDEHVARMAAIAPGSVIWFGMDQDRPGRISATDVTVDDADRASFTLMVPGAEPQPVHLAISGAHNVINALAAATVAIELGMDPAVVADSLGRVSSISPHRMAVSEVHEAEASFTLIDDSFNANPDSMRAGLDGLARWHRDADAQPYRIAVLGSMLELGADEHELHRGIGAYAMETGVDALVAVGGADPHLHALAEDMAKGAGEALDRASQSGVSIDWVGNIDQADAEVRALAAAHPGAVVLLKGSHASGLDALAERWACAAASQAVQAETNKQGS